MRFRIFFFSLLLIINIQVYASGLIGLGYGSIPIYKGSLENQKIPIGVANFEFGNHILEIEGPEIFYNYRIMKKISLGTMVSFDFGRDPIENNQILESSEGTHLPASIDYGISSQLKLPSLMISNEDEFSFRLTIQKNTRVKSNGNTFRLNLSYFLKILFLLRTEIELEYRYSKRGYLNYYYGVSHDDSSLNGLNTFNYSSGGSESITYAQNIILSFSEHYGVFYRFEFARFLNEVKNSPYIAQIGNRNNQFHAVALFYRW